MTPSLLLSIAAIAIAIYSLIVTRSFNEQSARRLSALRRVYDVMRHLDRYDVQLTVAKRDLETLSRKNEMEDEINSLHARVVNALGEISVLSADLKQLAQFTDLHPEYYEIVGAEDMAKKIGTKSEAALNAASKFIRG